MPAVYRVRATWRDRFWIVTSPDVAGLELYARRLDQIERKARDEIARRSARERWSFSVVVQQALVDDAVLQSLVERSLASRSMANRLGREATVATFQARDSLAAARMGVEDASAVLGLGDAYLQRRRDGVCDDLFDEPPWSEPYYRDDFWCDTVDPWNPRHQPSNPTELKLFLDALGEEVGGGAALAVLDDAPLPDEDFLWDGIDDDICVLVNDVRASCDHGSEAVFDVEFRTASRRLLAATARRGPDYFRKRADHPERTAAALCWALGKANRLFNRDEPPRIKDLAGALGVPTPGSRATGLLKAGGFEHTWGNIVLGSARYLVSMHRRRIIELRDTYAVSKT